jgi:hypothetical protein
LPHLAKESRDAAHVAAEETHPADEIGVQLTRVRRLGARVVVQTGSEDVLLGTSTPAVSLLGREGLAVVRLQVTVLSAAVPVKVTLQERVDGAQPCFDNLGVYQLVVRSAVLVLGLVE